MTSSNVSIVRTDLAGYEGELRELLGEYFVEANEAGREWFDDEEFGADPEGLVAADLERLASPEIPDPLFLALRDGRIVGSVQLKRLTGEAAEVKRLYVRPGARGEGIGRELVETLVEEATADGFEVLRLGVAPYHERAQELYRSLGFEPIPPYEQTQAPPGIHDDWTFMERQSR